MPKTKREIEIEALLAMTDQDLIGRMELELFPADERKTGEPETSEQAFMRRFMNLARKGAGLPEVAQY